MDLWSRSSGNGEALGKGGTLAKMELWSRSSGDDEALIAGFARRWRGVDDRGSVAKGTGEKKPSSEGWATVSNSGGGAIAALGKQWSDEG